MAAVDLFYWDACIFYEHCREDQADPYKAQAIKDLLAENREKRNRICTSIITHTEVVPAKLGDGKDQVYWDCFTSQFLFDIEIDRSIILLGREIRNYYYKPPGAIGGYRMMSMGDAIHLATAIVHGAAEFHTRDGNRKGGNIPLLGLDDASPGGELCGRYPLKISSPIAEQIRFV